MNVLRYNAEAWDREVAGGQNPWSQPVTKLVIDQARQGEFSIVLTPNRPVPRRWFPDTLDGTDLLGLASGGGQQMPILAAAGAKVTSFDASSGQLGRDRLVAQRDGLTIKTVQGDAADLSCFESGSFDVVFHPCSNCFMEHLQPIWNEAFRVLRPGGTLLSGFHNGILFLFDREKDEKDGILEVRYSLPYSDMRDLPKDSLQAMIDRNEAIEFGHTLEQQIGGQIRAGFDITGFYEDNWSDEVTSINQHCPLFIATKATKRH
ncbi:MAG: class I SAM-dependent methyltransferase [Planctomycetota bacterium]